MAHHDFNVKRQYQLLGDLLRPIDLENALLFCNHVLTACRGEESDPVVRKLVSEWRLPRAPFLIHLAARQILLQSLGPSNRGMGTDDFKRLLGMLWEIIDHDPAMEDPSWAQSDPLGCIIRFVGLQQRPIDILLQTYGLAVALFTNDMPIGPDETMDIAIRVEQVLQMNPLVFMRAGFVAGAVRMANSGTVKLAGTITTDLVETRPLEVGDGVPERWVRFIQLVSGSQREFKKRSRDLAGPDADIRYQLYRFNMLKRFPSIDVGGSKFVTVDRELLFSRTTHGIYYDLHEADGKAFTDSFGYRFGNLVGNLTRRACGENRFWSESILPQQVRANLPSKNADHAILSDAAIVLIESKALRPTKSLLEYGDPADTNRSIARVASAVRQLAQHAHAIGSGKWAFLGLPVRDCYGIVVTYGCIPIANGSLFRHKVRELLTKEGCVPLPYLVLSISEFDSFLHLAELGYSPAAVMATFAANENASFPGSFQSALSCDAISVATRRRGEAFLATLPDKPDEIQC